MDNIQNKNTSGVYHTGNLPYTYSYWFDEWLNNDSVVNDYIESQRNEFRNEWFIYTKADFE